MGHTRFRCLEAYLARLPKGLDSYPQCTAKASLLGMALESAELAEESSLPDALRSVFAAPPPVSTWVPEVVFNAATVAAYDWAFGGKAVGAFEQRVCDFNLALFRKPLYRILYAFISPTRLAKESAKRWPAFHRGTSLRIVELAEGKGVLELEFPEHLFDPLVLRAFKSAWRASLLATGAEQVRSLLDDATTSTARYVVRWL
ncbi:MAG: hypothetical protein AAF721_21270, partial [Myxococcota bacterium]